MTRENALAGHTLAAWGMSSSLISVGRMRVKPETKNSVMNWDMAMLKTKRISLQSVVKMGGRSRPRRSILDCSDSSTADSGMFFATPPVEEALVVVSWLFETDSCKLWPLDASEATHEALLKVLVGIARNSVCMWYCLLLLRALQDFLGECHKLCKH